MRCVRRSGPVASCVISTTAILVVCSCASMVQLSAKMSSLEQDSDGDWKRVQWALYLRRPALYPGCKFEAGERAMGNLDTKPIVTSRDPLFRPFTVKTLTLKNRVV